MIDILRLPATLVVLMLLTAGSHAASFEDSRSGLVVNTSDDFYVSSDPVPGQEGASWIWINRRDAVHPFVPGSTSPLCVLTQWPDATLAGMSQTEIDANAPNLPANIIADMAGAAELQSAEPFQHQGLAGMEVITRLTQSATNEEFLVFFAVSTPRGNTSMACAATSQTLALALPAYRHLFSGVVFPQ